MQPAQIRNTLKQTLDDRRLTRGEKQALSRILDHVDPADDLLAVYRSIAFDLAREEAAAAGPHAAMVVDWLEDVVKVLQAQQGDSQRRHIAEACFTPDDDCPSRIRGLFLAAGRTADVCVFTITDDRITEAILEAHRRGVAVRIVSDDEKAGDLGSDVDSLARQGVPVRFDRSPYHMHHKFAIFDGTKLLTGSYNWTRTASRENEENFLITDNPRFVQRFAETFETLWRKFA